MTQVGAAHRLGRVGVRTLSPRPSSRARSQRRRRRGCRRDDARARRLAPRGARDRRADQADADQGERARRAARPCAARLRAAMNAASAASAASFASLGADGDAQRVAAGRRPRRRRSDDAALVQERVGVGGGLPPARRGNATSTKLPTLGVHRQARARRSASVSQRAATRSLCAARALDEGLVAERGDAGGHRRAASTLNGPRMRFSASTIVRRRVAPAEPQRRRARRSSRRCASSPRCRRVAASSMPALVVVPARTYSA